MTRRVSGWGELVLPIVALGLALGCGKSWKEEYDESQEALTEAQGQLTQAAERQSELESDNASMRALLESQGRDMSDMNSVRERLEADLAEARAREAEQQARLAALRAMAAQFRELVATGQLRVRIVRGNMVVELPNNVLFDSGSASLREAGEEALTRVATVLATVPNRDFLVAGHTDNVPLGRRSRYRNNWELSAARGVAVTRFLAEHGVNEEHLAAAGYADTRPVASNSDPEGQAQNRRIEIIVLPNLDELPDLSSLENDLPSER